MLSYNQYIFCKTKIYISIFSNIYKYYFPDSCRQLGKKRNDDIIERKGKKTTYKTIGTKLLSTIFSRIW